MVSLSLDHVDYLLTDRHVSIIASAGVNTAPTSLFSEQIWKDIRENTIVTG